jgi:hypothetical protein
MEQIVPWAALCEVVEPHYPKAGNGRPPVGLERMLRMYFVQHWFNLADAACEDALLDSTALRRFVGIDLGRERVPDATTLLKFRRRLEEQQGLSGNSSGCRTGGFRRLGGVKGGRAGRMRSAGRAGERQRVSATEHRTGEHPAKRTLDADRTPLRWREVECGMLTHSTPLPKAFPCTTSSSNLRWALLPRGRSLRWISTLRPSGCWSSSTSSPAPASAFQGSRACTQCTTPLPRTTGT